MKCLFTCSWNKIPMCFLINSIILSNFLGFVVWFFRHIYFSSRIVPICKQSYLDLWFYIYRWRQKRTVPRVFLSQFYSVATCTFVPILSFRLHTDECAFRSAPFVVTRVHMLTAWCSCIVVCGSNSTGQFLVFRRVDSVELLDLLF